MIRYNVAITPTDEAQHTGHSPTAKGARKVEFSIRFAAKIGTAIDKDGLDIGLRFLYRVRAEFGSQIEAKDVASRCDSWRNDIFIVLDESQARESNRFDNTTSIRVVVPEKSLNQFVSVGVVSVDLPRSDGKCMYKPQYQIDTQAVIDEWLAAGAPLDWDVDVEGEDNE